MARFTLRGAPCATVGELPKVGAQAPAFTVVKSDLSSVSNATYAGKTVILNIFPSVDTPTCATSVRTFNAKAAKSEDRVVICVSADLPFALGRFCGAEGIDRVVATSSFRSSFGKDYGLAIADGPLQGLLARAIVVIGPTGTVKHAQLVGEIANEPDYQAALTA
jgi:thiol peroxidase